MVPKSPKSARSPKGWEFQWGCCHKKARASAEVVFGVSDACGFLVGVGVMGPVQGALAVLVNESL